ncbi:MAG TPA: hypothetical protein VG900_12820 [Hyphomicrobiaceae bacterium]|jgi:hypothetical protein|nr:hypothetical protein [Hyphomicrobiaceae bacterium]
MFFIGRLLAIVVFVMTAATAVAQDTPQPSISQCGEANVPCWCSFTCCGQERCDGSSCNQCVRDCVVRNKPADERFATLKARCQSFKSQKYRRF